MPENTQEQDIYKRYGTPIADKALPYDHDRRILIDSTGCCSLAFESKRSEEVLDYFADFMKWLEPNEIVIGAAAWSSTAQLFITRLEYASTGVVAWLAGGEDNVRHTISIQVSTSLGRIKLVQFIVITEGNASDPALLSVNNNDVTVGPNHLPIPEQDKHPVLTAYPAVIEFPLTAAISGQPSNTLIIKNDGTDTAHIDQIFINQPFFQINAGIQRLAPGEFTQLTITYKPIDIAQHTGALQIDYGEGLQVLAQFSGESESADRVYVSGNQFVLVGGQNFKIKAINWFGAETELGVAHGLWSVNYKDLANHIQMMGFNAVRLPFSGDICNNERLPESNSINLNVNPELDGLTAIQVFDRIITYLNQLGLYVILDHHRRSAGDGADGSPIDVNYTLDQWKASWLFMVERYKHFNFVLGADLHNEPHLLQWDVWAGYAEFVGNAILSVASHWLIFVEGVGSYGANSYWWGGELSGVANRPVRLNVAGRLAYSAHEYGISVDTKPWLAKNNAVPAHWPFNLYSVWRQHWGFIVEQNIAPVFIGEVGGKFGVNGNGVITESFNTQYERQWMYHLQRYMEGYFYGSEERILPENKVGMSFGYWALNPNSVDTGGILQDDWLTRQNYKLRVIAMALLGEQVPEVYGLTPKNYGDLKRGNAIVTIDGIDYAIDMVELMKASNIFTDAGQSLQALSQDTLLKSDNLAALTNKTTARNNLGVLSTTETSDMITTNGTAVLGQANTYTNNAIAAAAPVDATETAKGIIEIATQVESNAGTDDVRAITPKKLKTYVETKLNISGTAPVFQCRAWGYFNGSATPVAMGSSGNVFSIVETAANSGTYAVTFSTAMPHANYAVVTSASARADAGSLNIVDGTKTVNGFTIRANFGGDNTAGVYRPYSASFAVFC